jgi:hypothetical protein
MEEAWLFDNSHTMETSDDDDEYLGTGGKLGSQKQEA